MRRVCTLWAMCVLTVGGVSAGGGLPAPRLADALQGRTVGQAREGKVQFARGHVTVTHWNGWVRYAPPSWELPATACTIAVSVRVDDDFQEGMLLSDAYERQTMGVVGTTWPSLEVVARRAGPTSFRVSFGYTSEPRPDPDRWHIILSPELPTGRWHDLAFSWGPRGQMIWVGDRIRACSKFSGRYQTDPSTPLFRGWGLGCLYNTMTPGCPDPAPQRSACPVSFRNLRVWADQVWLGPRQQL